jgi:hypothetical protein
MYWEILVSFLAGAVVASIPWLLSTKNTSKAMELLASRSFSDYSVGAARIAKATTAKQENPNDYSSVWSEESHG